MRGRSKAARVVYPAIFGAVALVLLYLGTMVPTGTWGVAAVAGIMPVFAVVSSGLASGFLCWAGVALLAFLLLWEVMCLEQAPNPFAFSVGNADRIFEPYRAADGLSREESAALFTHFLVFFNVGERSWAIS